MSEEKEAATFLSIKIEKQTYIYFFKISPDLEDSTRESREDSDLY